MSDSSPSLIRRLFGFLWTLVVFVYRGLLILSLCIFAFVAWMAVQGGPPIKVEDNVALVVAPTGQLVDQVDREPTEILFESLSGEPPAQSVVSDVVKALERAADDDRIALAVLKLDGLVDAGMPQLEEITQAMRAFQAKGKKIVAYGPWYDQMHYYAAAQADEIVLDPLGLVFVEGFSVYNNYFKEALDKLGVDVNVFRVGEYKSAVEPFTRNDMSVEARSANLEWLGDLWQSYGKAVAAGRELPPDAADAYVRNMRAALAENHGDTADYALDAGLVTAIETLTEFRKRISGIVGVDDDHGSFRQIHYSEYLRALHQHDRKLERGSEGKVALVVVQGDIVEGGSDVGQAGGDTIVELLDEARRDDDVDAVLLRVDSPGGSVWASEQIRRAVQQLRAEGKPVVASMSTVAASGGYWVSMDADQIFAHDATITGSIGIFGLVPTIDRALGKLGIHTDGIGTTPMAGAFRLDRPITPELAQIIQLQIDKGYRDFIEGVAKARRLPVEKVDEIARGRVWSGQDALAIGLVDQIGGMDAAADAAAKLAGLDVDDYTLEQMEPPHDFAARFLSRFSGSLSLDVLPGAGALARTLARKPDLARALDWLDDPRAMYAYCFCTPSAGGRAAGR